MIKTIYRDNFNITGERTTVEKIPVIIPRAEIEKIINDGQIKLITLLHAVEKSYSYNLFGATDVCFSEKQGNSWVDLKSYNTYSGTFTVIRKATEEEIVFCNALETARQSYFVQKLQD